MLEISKGGKPRFWKSSPLALLFHGFDAKTQQDLALVDDVHDMTRRAKDLRVQLRQIDGWRFVETGRRLKD